MGSDLGDAGQVQVASAALIAGGGLVAAALAAGGFGAATVLADAGSPTFTVTTLE
jgi:F0F1-type ATP synthase membrane subunit c/vacuolar-type H+-ATPase subunit K